MTRLNSLTDLQGVLHGTWGDMVMTDESVEHYSHVVLAWLQQQGFEWGMEVEFPGDDHPIWKKWWEVLVEA
jgi:hypothetical protein